MKLTKRQREVLTKMNEGCSLSYIPDKGLIWLHNKSHDWVSSNTVRSLVLKKYIVQKPNEANVYVITEQGKEALR